MNIAKQASLALRHARIIDKMAALRECHGIALDLLASPTFGFKIVNEQCDVSAPLRSLKHIELFVDGMIAAAAGCKAGASNQCAAAPHPVKEAMSNLTKALDELDRLATAQE